MKKLLLSTSVLATFGLTTHVNADTVESVQNQIDATKTAIQKVEKKQDNKNVIDHVMDFFTVNTEAEEKDKLSEKLDELETQKANLEMQEKAKIVKEKLEAEKRAKEEAEKAEAERVAKEKAEKEAAEKAAAEAQASTQTSSTSSDTSSVQFGSDGLLIEQASGTAQQVINMLLAIPGHANGAGYHGSIDPVIDQLSTAEAVYVIHRIEGAGFGQTGAGYAGYDTPESHQAFVNQQVNNRFGGSVHALLKAWGTFSYGGY